MCGACDHPCAGEKPTPIRRSSRPGVRRRARARRLRLLLLRGAPPGRSSGWRPRPNSGIRRRSRAIGTAARGGRSPRGGRAARAGRLRYCCRRRAAEPRGGGRSRAATATHSDSKNGSSGNAIASPGQGSHVAPDRRRRSDRGGRGSEQGLIPTWLRKFGRQPERESNAWRRPSQMAARPTLANSSVRACKRCTPGYCGAFWPASVAPRFWSSTIRATSASSCFAS